jgi:serine/threonine protein kinase
VLIYECLTGQMPFGAPTLAGVLQAIVCRPVTFPAGLSEGACDFLALMLERDVGRRASAAQLLQHPWLLSQQASQPQQQGGGGDDIAAQA